MKKIYKKMTLLCCMAVLALSSGVFAQADCSTAVDVSAEGAFNTGAVTGAYDVTVASCMQSAPDAMNWFSYTATADGELTVSSVGSGVDTQCAAATGACGSLTEVACSEDFNPAYESEMSFPVTTGETYSIVWGNGWGGAAASFSVAFTAAVAGEGCTVASACNFDPAATVEDGSCIYAAPGFDCNGDCLVGVAVVYAAGGFAGENSFTINDCDGNVLASMASGAIGFNSCVVLPAIYTVILTDSYGDTWNGGTLTVDGVVYDQPATAGAGTATSDTYQVGSCPVYGCTDVTAANYDVTATVNATSSTDPTDPCTYGIPGCTDATACNFDAGATANDGSCTYAAAGFDCNGDCLVGSPVVITLTDSYGDTWNGGTLTVGGVVYDQPTTAAAGTVTSDTYNACLDLSGCLIAEYNTGAFSGEHSWSIADDAGVVLASGVGSTVAYGTALGDGCGVLGCADAAALNYDATADSCDGLVGGTDTSCCTYPPVNDDCSGAIVVACGDVVSGSSVNSTIGNEVLALECGTAISSPGVWYTFSSTGSEEVTFSTCNFVSAGAPLDTKINVFSGSCGAYVCAGGNDDAGCPNFLSEVTVITPAAPTDYFIHVSGYGTQTGAFDLTVSCDVASCIPPINDVCASAFPVPDGTAFIDDNVCAQGNDLVPACAGFGAVDGVWYTWNSGASNALTLDFGPAVTPDAGDSAAANPSIAMFSGNCANPTELNCFNGAASESITGLNINTTYYFLVFTDADVDQGQFDLTLTGGVAGCATVGACNYDASATVDDGSCDLSCLGCTDPLALNYDAAALADDGSCVVPSCDPIVSTEAAICYDSSGNETYNFTENTPGEGVSVLFNAGTVEAGWDVISVFDDLGVQLNTQIDGDLTGLIFTSAGALSINIVSDASVSCASGSQTEISLTVYCGALEVVGCFDPLATNYDAAANSGDQVALCQYLGCTDVLACNYEALAITDDGSCCLTNCVTVTISDTFGDGGASVTIFDDLGNTVASLVHVAGAETVGTFCIADACADVVVSVDAFPGESGVLITDQNGELLNFATGSISGGSTTTITVGAAVGCVVSGCNDATALNYNAAANADCLDVFGGTDVSCCIYPVANNDCDGAIALAAGVEAAWDTNNTDDSGNNCSPTLTNDVWYTYTPTCDLEVTVTSSSNQGGQVAIWEGDCSALTLVECGPNEGFIATTISAVLTAGVTYSIQTGSNADFGPLSTGTILLEEGLCRGCTYISSPDYSAAAGIDDGSCTFEDCSCPGDFTGDGFINVSDLGGFLGAFGEACE